MLLSQVEAMREQLRPSERKLADYVLEAPREVLDLSMTDFAARAGVSQPTIARFCQALGFSGFREFKIRLAQSIAADVPTVYRDVRTDEPAAGRRRQGARPDDRRADPGAQQPVVGQRRGGDRDPGAKRGASSSTARAARASPRSTCSTSFSGSACRRVAYSDPHTYTTSAALLGAGDVVVAISNTGRTRDILDACRSALDGGAKVIAITHGNSPLARMATVGLFANVDEDTDIFSPMTSRVSHLAIGDILAVGVALARGPQLAEKLARGEGRARKTAGGA